MLEIEKKDFFFKKAKRWSSLLIFAHPNSLAIAGFVGQKSGSLMPPFVK
jgi:hypothetical protein